MKYDLSDLGLLYKGPATHKEVKYIKTEKYDIIDVPGDLDTDSVINFVEYWMRGICAFEFPTSLFCNLDCKYCYIEDSRMKNKKVKPEEIENLIKEIPKMFYTENAKELYFTPWGAEPFAEIETMEAMLETAAKLFGIEKIKTSTSTNGTIFTDSAIKFIEKWTKLGVIEELQISLDGPEWVQNRYRPYKSGKGSFNDVKEFTMAIRELEKEIGRKIHHFCSTIYIYDEKFIEAWRDSFLFFSEPDTWHYSSIIPIRISWFKIGEKEIQKFLEAQKIMFEITKERTERNIKCLNFFTSKLFLSNNFRTRNAFPYCSAMNTQVGIDLDGSIYPCHGPITSPMYKPFFWIGNIYEKIISFTGLIRNLGWMYNTWTRAKCTHCELFKEATGSVCWSCPPHQIAITGEPAVDDFNKCVMYKKAFPYWKKIAWMQIKGNPYIENLNYNLPRLENPFEFRGPEIEDVDQFLEGALNKFGFNCNCKIISEWFDLFLNSFNSVLKTDYLKMLKEFTEEE